MQQPVRVRGGYHEKKDAVLKAFVPQLFCSNQKVFSYVCCVILRWKFLFRLLQFLFCEVSFSFFWFLITNSSLNAFVVEILFNQKVFSVICCVQYIVLCVTALFVVYTVYYSVLYVTILFVVYTVHYSVLCFTVLFVVYTVHYSVLCFTVLFVVYTIPAADESAPGKF